MKVTKAQNSGVKHSEGRSEILVIIQGEYHCANLKKGWQGGHLPYMDFTMIKSNNFLKPKQEERK
jgi:hypothetical protein